MDFLYRTIGRPICEGILYYAYDADETARAQRSTTIQRINAMMLLALLGFVITMAVLHSGTGLAIGIPGFFLSWQGAQVTENYRQFLDGENPPPTDHRQLLEALTDFAPLARLFFAQMCSPSPSKPKSIICSV